MWPSAVVLSSWLLANPEILFDKQIIELGAGCGLTGLVASRIVAEYENEQRRNVHNSALHRQHGKHEEKKDDGVVDNQGVNKEANRVIMTDFNTKVLKNLDRNITLNGLQHVAKTMHLDFYAQKGMNRQGGWTDHEFIDNGTSTNDHTEVDQSNHQSPADLIIAADVICKPSDSIAASKTIYDVLKPGGEAIIVSANAKHRFGVDIFEKECLSLGLDVQATDVGALCDGRLITKTELCEDACGIRQTSGYVDGMSLTMFRVNKPI